MEQQEWREVRVGSRAVVTVISVRCYMCGTDQNKGDTTAAASSSRLTLECSSDSQLRKPMATHPVDDKNAPPYILC